MAIDTHRLGSRTRLTKQISVRLLVVVMGCLSLGSNGSACSSDSQVAAANTQCTESRESCEMEHRCWRIRTKGETKGGLGFDPTTRQVDVDVEDNGECNIECVACADGAMDAGADADADPKLANPVDSAIEHLAAASCERNFLCSPVWMEYKAGTKEACAIEVGRVLRWEAALPGAGFSVAALEECIDELARVGCDAASYACVYGTRMDGAACASGAQCRSGWCTGDAASCGSCVPEPDRSGKCATDANCFYESHCSNEEHCELDFREGHSCTREAECDVYLSCIGGACVPNDQGQGERCGDSIGLCDQFHAQLTCAGGTCRFASFANPGEACPELGWCRGGGGCLDNVCQSGPAPGAPCEDDSNCGWQAFCSHGTCLIPGGDPCAAN
jgi:hypothetical protein